MTNTNKLKVEQENTILCENQKVLIEWPNVDTTTYQLSAPNRKKGSIPELIVIHWDATYSSKHCYDILKKRNLSIHFSINNDGTIFQMCDTSLSSQHASVYNSKSIGIEISNAVELKYQKWYTDHGFEPRPIVKNKTLNGHKYPNFLGFYPTQIQATKVLVKTLANFYGIPLKVPTKDDKYLEEYLGAKKMKIFKNGVCGHLHLDAGKWDPLGFNLLDLIS